MQLHGISEGHPATATEDPLKRTYSQSIVAHPGRFSGDVVPALLCIDLQYLDAAPDQGIFRGMAGAERFYFRRLDEVVVPNVRRLQRAFRRAGREVVHVRIQSYTRDGRDRSPAHKRLGLLAPPGSRDAQILERVRPIGDEIVVNKTASGVFESTNLRYVLQNIGINSLVITGVYTDECISTTVRVASDIGFYVTLVEDACTSVTPELHNASVATLRDRYARVIDTEAAVRELGDARSPSLPRRAAASESEHERERAGPTSRRTVVLLGGSAFANDDQTTTLASQLDFARRAADALLPLFENGRQVLVSHGNGPHVARTLAAAESRDDDGQSLQACVAESEGELGYVLQQCFHNSLRHRSPARSVVSVTTQTVVDREDPALQETSKPIGPGYDTREAALSKEGSGSVGWTSDGWRRTVPSPRPRDVVESDAIESMLDLGFVVIALGGGGVPVVRTPHGLQGVDAVVDKDLAGALLARNLRADDLFIVTSVPCAYTSYGTPDETPLGDTSPTELRALLAEGHFGVGTMAPKIQAACDFADTGGTAVICDVDSLPAALNGLAGTRVRSDRDRAENEGGLGSRGLTSSDSQPRRYGRT